ncbi:hypothetical protein HPB49_020361 [Dermacentor silvarum]|uniref:Uncharacterized protein n=1 Tax=Dermacentor silvarum TaxID=543639 RepID=A0ACB8DFT5_DERSI|nr:hypothetical protein HPB49_020361 [Dermacentor silvarum]
MAHIPTWCFLLVLVLIQVKGKMFFRCPARSPAANSTAGKAGCCTTLQLVDAVQSAWARPEHRLRCTARGSFEPLQCSDSYCYCLRRDGSLDGRPVRRSSSVHDLKCCASTAQLRGINKSDNATTPPPLLFVIGGRE